jgi:hypothetical protein
MNLPENVTVYEGGRKHRGEIPDATVKSIEAVEENEAKKERPSGKKNGTLSGSISKAQSILDKQTKKSEKKSEPVIPAPVKTEAPEKQK